MTGADVFAGRTAVVTGAGSGIGRALVVELAGRGANVAASDVDDAGLEETARLAGAGGGGKVVTYHLDVADREAVVGHAREVAETFSAVHLVVNNAGVAVGATVEETTYDDFDWLLGVNLFGVINGTKAFLPYLIASGEGHVVNLSSVFGLIAPAYHSAYSASKFAVRGFTESLRQEMIMAGHPVTVHSVHPGGIRTNIARNARISAGAHEVARKDPTKEFERIARTTPARAAQVILRGVERNSTRILVGPDAYVIAALPRLLGARYVEIFGRVGRRMRSR